MNAGYTLKAPLKYYNNTFFQMKGETQKIDNRNFIPCAKVVGPLKQHCHIWSFHFQLND